MREGIEFRFTLSHAIEGSLEIDEPVKWNGSKFNLKRDDKYHSLFFEYSSQLQFYFKNAERNGGAEFIKYIEGKYGPDEVINILVEISDHNEDWETIFVGTLNLEDLGESELYVECMMQQSDFISTFNNRTDLQVSFADNISVDGVALQEYEPYDLTLHSKVLIKEVLAEVKEETLIPIVQTHDFTINAGAPGFPDPGKTGGPTAADQPAREFASRTSYISLGFVAGRKELSDYWDVGTAPAVPDEPPEIYTAGEAGLHDFNFEVNLDILVEAANLNTEDTYLTCGDEFPLGLIENASAELFFVIKDVNDQIKYTNTFATVSDVITNCSSVEATIPVNASFSLSDYNLDVDDQVFIYAAVTMSGTYARKLLNAKVGYGVGYLVKEGSSLRITGKTYTTDSTAPAMRVHDVLQNLINKITNRNDSFYSETFGYPEAPYHSYEEKGCYADFVILSGFNIRGFPWEDRPLQPVFNELFDSLNAIFNLSLSLEVIDDVEKIRIEKKSYCYDKEVILALDKIRGIKRTIAKDKFYSQIQVGYEKGLPKDLNGLDEPNVKQTYSTALKTIGQPLMLISKLIASGSILEVTRRLQYDATVTTDSEYDNDLFIVALNHSDPTRAEKNENYSDVNNLLSPETTYNLDLTPKKNLLRHGNIINPGLLQKLGSEYKFSSGEGNYKLETRTDNECPGGYNGDLLLEGTSEKWAYADVEEVEPLWVNYIFRFKYPLSVSQLKLIRENKNKALLISGDIHEEGEVQTVFIVEIETEPVTGLATFTCIGASVLPFNYVPEDIDNLLLQDGSNLLYEDGSLILI